MIEPATEYSFTTLASIPTERGALGGSILFEIIDGAKSTSLSAPFNRVALSPTGITEYVPCDDRGVAADMLPVSQVGTSNRILAGVRTAFLPGVSDIEASRHIFMIEILIANARSVDILVQFMYLSFVDERGSPSLLSAHVKAKLEDTEELRIGPGRISRVEDSVALHTAKGNLRVQLHCLIPASGSKVLVEFEAGMSHSGLQVDRFPALGFVEEIPTVERFGPIRSSDGG